MTTPEEYLTKLSDRVTQAGKLLVIEEIMRESDKEGFDRGYMQGHAKGCSEGYKDGFELGQKLGMTDTITVLDKGTI